jgi:hypothetical protein
MRRHHVSSITQTLTSTPSKDALIEIPIDIATRRATQAPAIVLRLMLGMGVVLLLALLSAWLSPSTRAAVRDFMLAGQPQVQTLSSEALEEMGMPSVLLDDIWTRL